MDLFSRKIVGWHLKAHMQEALILEAYQKALTTRIVPGDMIVHSDRGGQYTGSIFRKLLDKKHLFPLCGGKGRADNVYDNRFMETLFSRFKPSCSRAVPFRTAVMPIREFPKYIEMYYNTQSRHPALNYQSPVNYENNYYNSLT